jgi:hypothetical protein
MSFRKYGQRTMKSYPRKRYSGGVKGRGVSRSRLMSKYKSRASGPLSYPQKGPELKVLEGSTRFAQPGWSGVNNGAIRCSTEPLYRVLNLIPVGSGVSARIGRRVEMQTLQMRFCARQNSQFNGEGGGSFLRLLVVYDRQPTGDYPGVNDLLAVTTYGNNGLAAATSTSFDPLGNININFRDRFKILMDEKLVFNGPNDQSSAPGNGAASVASFSGGVGLSCDKYLKLKGLSTMFGADNGAGAGLTISDIKTGALYLVTVSTAGDDGGTFAESPYVVDFCTRLIYSDK